LASAADLLRYESSVDAMGSTFSVAAYGPDRDSLAAAVEQALEEAKRLDHMLSNYRHDSEWSQVNRFAGQREFTVSQELFDLLAACYAYSQHSQGTFDITVGPLMKVWGFYKGSGRMPHRAEIRTALGRIGYENLLLNPTQRTVRFAKNGLEIDPGGIGKGYAVDRMAEILRRAGVRSALINAGGSSMLFTVRRKTYSHIMDPRTGYPAEGMFSVSVIAPRGIDSEAWTKPVYINGRSWAARNIPKGFRAYLCEGRSEYPGEAKCAWLQ